MRVLVANRGEIALRVVRACRDLGVTSIAVYAEQDREALHVRAADEAYALRGSTAATSYLDQDRILAIAARSGATAVHPGYGFLAENAGFARAVLAAGLVWVGPPPSAMEALADKVAARRVALRVGAPVVPASDGPVVDADAVVAFARRHGLPVAIKAVHGGGGRGLRVAHREAEIPDLFASCVREAHAAFGDGACFVERYVEHPRHVETQCLADATGQVAVLSTRDCTLQRRHQKLVEEAPAPFLDGATERSLVEASRAVLTEVGYVGAATCEFLLGRDGTATFLEVNTRLQVEHPVTEEVTGVDLVLEQLRLAHGEPLGYTEVPVRGHAIEFRINAEDPARAFAPTPGTLRRWRPPGGPGVRVDSGVETGDTVDGSFDSLLAKLVVTGRDRAHALARARRALAEFDVEGVPTVLDLHRAVLRDPAFAPGDPAAPFTVHTGWIEQDFLPAASGFAGVTRTVPPRPPVAESAPPEAVAVTVELDGRRYEVRFPDGVPSAPGGPAAEAPPTRTRRPRRPGTRGGATDDVLRAPMQGTVVRVEVEDGQRVRAGDAVVVLEAMKLEQVLAAPRDGDVADLSVEPGQLVAAGAPVCRISAAGA